MEGFIESTGLPDFIYEFTNKAGREGVNLYYVDKDLVYTFIEHDWKPDSLYLEQYRKLNDYEKTLRPQLLIQ